MRIAVASAVGAFIGGCAGYLFFTEHGRRVRLQIEPTVDHLRHEVMSFAKSLEGVSSVARDGWQLIQEVIAEDRVRPGAPLTH